MFLFWSFLHRFSADSKRAIFLTRAAASKLGGDEMMCGHLVVALLESGDRETQRVLACVHDKEALQHDIEQQFHGTVHVACDVDMRMSAELTNVIKTARAEARSRSRREVQPGDLLLGLLRSQDTPVTRVLEQHGLSYERAVAATDDV